MRNDLYLIPANSKKGKLIFNMFRGIDLAVFSTGLAVTIIMFVVLTDASGLLASLLKILPISLGSFLVVPIPNYHNVMEFCKDVWNFFTNRRLYKWKGWCVRSEYGEK